MLCAVLQLKIKPLLSSAVRVIVDRSFYLVKEFEGMVEVCSVVDVIPGTLDESISVIMSTTHGTAGKNFL